MLECHNHETSDKEVTYEEKNQPNREVYVLDSKPRVTKPSKPSENKVPVSEQGIMGLDVCPAVFWSCFGPVFSHFAST